MSRTGSTTAVQEINLKIFFSFHKDVEFLINYYVKTNQLKKKREGRTALAARIASPRDAGRAGVQQASDASAHGRFFLNESLDS